MTEQLYFARKDLPEVVKACENLVANVFSTISFIQEVKYAAENCEGQGLIVGSCTSDLDKSVFASLKALQESLK